MCHYCNSLQRQISERLQGVQSNGKTGNKTPKRLRCNNYQQCATRHPKKIHCTIFQSRNKKELGTNFCL